MYKCGNSTGFWRLIVRVFGMCGGNVNDGTLLLSLSSLDELRVLMTRGMKNTLSSAAYFLLSLFWWMDRRTQTSIYILLQWSEIKLSFTQNVSPIIPTTHSPFLYTLQCLLVWQSPFTRLAFYCTQHHPSSVLPDTVNLKNAVISPPVPSLPEFLLFLLLLVTLDASLSSGLDSPQ